MKRFLTARLAAAAAVSTSVAYDELPYKTHFDSDIQTGQTDTLYRLDPITGEQVYWSFQEQVIVDSGATLVIDSGALILGNLGPAGHPAGALVCAAGGRIIANGTEDYPIIMSAVGDGPEDPFDLGPGARSMWGGLVVLGNAQISNPDKPSESVYPGKHHLFDIPNDDPRAYYGSASDAYNNESSGIYRYISIRHGGFGDIANAEVNGMTFGGVGSGTVVEHIEVFASGDDGFEFFGGTVQAKYLVAAYCGDDHFDYDEGFRGKGQFWFAIHEDKDGDRGGEHDGYDDGDDDTLYSEPTIYNAAYIGSGRYSDNSSQHGIYFKGYAGGHYNNLIITEFSGQAIRTAEIQPWGGALTVDNTTAAEGPLLPKPIKRDE